MRPHRVVVIARVGRIDGRKRQIREILAPVHVRRAKPLRLGEGLRREVLRNPVLADRDCRHSGAGAMPRDDSGRAGTIAAIPGVQGPDLHKLAVLGAAALPVGHGPPAAAPLVRRHDAAAPLVLAEDAKLGARRRGDPVDHAGLPAPLPVPAAAYPSEDAVAFAERGGAVAAQDDAGRRPFAPPRDRDRDHAAVLGMSADRQHAHRRKAA